MSVVAGLRALGRRLRIRDQRIKGFARQQPPIRDNRLDPFRIADVGERIGVEE